ncbi:MAG: DNA replication and repair protein RecF [Chlamydiae bacterium]|jgi:DNA replication and repair protein RecF|nr:DNA replication and repair protein RecF [Chlamydiota bacterium]
MISLKRIRLFQFRNFKKIDLEFGDGLNAIIGPNAIGKTTLLEAIHFISTGRSFRTQKLQEVIKKGEKSFSLEAFFVKDDVEQTLSIFFNGKEKEIKHNQTVYSSFSPLLGLFPTVVYSPFDIEIIQGSPAERRRFLNILIAQLNPLYVYYLTRYSKALLQRNALLRRKNCTTIEIWEEELIKTGDFIQAKRAEVIQELSKSTKEFYEELSSNKEEVEILYKPSKISPSIFEKTRAKELILGYSLLGAHRDDLEINLGGLCAKNYASEGQKRTVIASLKLAEKKQLSPSILLIDDFGIHLDEARKMKFEEKIHKEPQLFLTSPSSLKSSRQAFLHSLNSLPEEDLALQ